MFFQEDFLLTVLSNCALVAPHLSAIAIPCIEQYKTNIRKHEMPPDQTLIDLQALKSLEGNTSQTQMKVLFYPESPMWVRRNIPCFQKDRNVVVLINPNLFHHPINDFDLYIRWEYTHATLTVKE